MRKTVLLTEVIKFLEILGLVYFNMSLKVESKRKRDFLDFASSVNSGRVEG